jgi:putative hydrolase of the HAD superfamily
MRAKAVVFDLFGTLIDDTPPEAYRTLLDDLAGHLGADPEAFRAAWRKHEISRYTGPIDDSFALMSADLGVTDRAGIDAALAYRREHLRRLLVPRPDALSTVQSLRERGLGVGMISNASSEMSRLWAESQFVDVFDAVLFSADERMMKPERRLYERMAELLEVSTQECVFVGDGAYRELQGAEAAGMTAVLIKAPHDRWEHEGTVDWAGPHVSSLSEVLALV